MAEAATFPFREMPVRRPTTFTPVVDALRRTILAEIAHTGAVLAGLLDRYSVRRLDHRAQAGLARSVAADRDLLDGLADGARFATSRAGLVQIASEARRMRPEAYTVGVCHLHDVAALCQVAAANTTRLASLHEVLTEAEALTALTAIRTDLTTASVLNSRAVVAATIARDAALMLCASSTRGEIQAVTEQILRLEILLERIAQILRLVELDLGLAE